jgi:cell division protein FtsL
MTKLRVLLLLLLEISALGLVMAQHRARTQFVELDRAQVQGRALDVRWNQLQVEQQELGKSALIDDKARNQLSMRTADLRRTLHLSLHDGAKLAASGSAAR